MLGELGVLAGLIITKRQDMSTMHGARCMEHDAWSTMLGARSSQEEHSSSLYLLIMSDLWGRYGCSAMFLPYLSCPCWSKMSLTALTVKTYAAMIAGNLASLRASVTPNRIRSLLTQRI
jgi:hypothetical protein